MQLTLDMWECNRNPACLIALRKPDPETPLCAGAQRRHIPENLPLSVLYVRHKAQKRALSFLAWRLNQQRLRRCPHKETRQRPDQQSQSSYKSTFDRRSSGHCCSCSRFNQGNHAANRFPTCWLFEANRSLYYSLCKGSSLYRLKMKRGS